MMKHHHQEEEEQNQQQQQEEELPRVYIINFANATTTTRTTTTAAAVDSSGGNNNTNNDDDDDGVVDSSSSSSRSQNKSHGPAAAKIIPQMNTLGMLLRQYIMSELDIVEQQQHDHDNSNIDAIILTGGLYNHFSVGADLNEMNQFLSLKKNNSNNNNRDDHDDDHDDDDNNSGVGGNGNGVVHLGSNSSRRNGTGSNNRSKTTTTTRRRSNYTLIDVVNRIESFPKPIIACISGNCFGGGLEIALSCHYRIACNAFCYTNPTTSSSNSSTTTTIVPTRFGLPEVLVGLIPGAGGTQRLPKLVGIQNSIELIVTGKHIDAKRAQNMGLIDDIVVPTTTTSLTTTDQSSSSSSYYYDMMLQRSQQWIMEMKKNKQQQQQQLLQQSAGSSSTTKKTIHHHHHLLRRTSLLPLREQHPAIVHGIFHVAQLSLPDIHGDGYCANAALIAIRAGVIITPPPAVNEDDDDDDDENDIDDDKKNTTRAKQQRLKQQQRQRRDVVVEYGMNIEREQFIDCLLSNQGRAMRHVFFAIRTAQKPITTTISIPSTKQPSCSSTLQKQQQQQNMDVNDHILIKHVRDYKNRITMMSMMENKTQNNNNNNKNAGTTAPASSSPATATNVVHVGVIGAGTMGSGIAIVLLNAGYTVYLVDVSKDALKRGIQNIHTNIQSSLKKKEISTLIANDRTSRIIGTTNIEDLKHCLLVVEAVIENMSLKCTIFQKLDKIIRNKQALLLTNTSTLDVDRMSNIAFDHHHDHNEKKSNNSHNRRSRRHSSRLGYFAGWHFFSPANRMPLVEIVISKRYTSHRTITILQALTKAIGKTGVVVGNCDGFCGNRMLKPYSAETCALLVEQQKQQPTTTPIITMRSRRHDDDDDDEKNNNNNRNNNDNYYNNEKMNNNNNSNNNNNNNNPIVRVDQALLKFGMKLGPFQMADLAGNDVGYNVRKARGWVRDDDDDSESDHSSSSSSIIIIPKNRPLRYTELPDIMVSKYHRYGQKVGKGWYDYHPNIGNGRIGIPSKQMMELINQYSISSSVVDNNNNNNNNSNILSKNYNDYVIERVLYPLVNEGFKCLEENIVRQPSDIDIVYIFGYGWPAYRGGPIYWANYEIGLDRLHVKLLEFSKQFPTDQHYIPSKLLQRCVQLDITVYEYYKRGLHQITNNNNNNNKQKEEQSSYSKL